MGTGRMLHPVRRPPVPLPAAGCSSHTDSMLLPVLPPLISSISLINFEAVAWVSIGGIHLYTSCCRIKPPSMLLMGLSCLEKLQAQPLQAAAALWSQATQLQLAPTTKRCPYASWAALTPRPLESILLQERGLRSQMPFYASQSQPGFNGT